MFKMKKIFLVILFLLFSIFSYSEEILIYSDYLEYDDNTKTLNAEGNVRIEKERVYLNSSSFFYNLNTEEGILKKSIFKIKNLRVKGEETYLKKNEYLVKNGEFTTCEKDTPHYKFSAKEFLIRNNKIICKKLSLRIKEKRLFTLKKFSLPIEIGSEEIKSKKNIFSPEIGISSKEKIFLRWNYNYNFRRDFSLSSFFRYSPWFGFQGGINFSGRKNEYKIENIISKTFETKDVLPDVWVKRYPEIKIEKGEKEFFKKFLSYYLEGSWGNFEENNFKIKSERKKIGIGFLSPLFHITRDTNLRFLLNYEKSKYTISDYKFQDLKYETVLNKSFGEKLSLQLNYINHRLKGETPFIFDRVELKEELKNKITKNISKYIKLETTSRYDLTNNKIYDTEVIMEYRVDCFNVLCRWSLKKNLWSVLLRSNLF
jgi:lipopolysaccharide assembly outer membrane protein LptD (OstA)